MDKNKIAKNTIWLYLRLAITIVISIYSSRVLLHALGIEQYGVYGVIGGIAAMFASLKSSFACAVQRYYNYSIGMEEGINKLKNIVNTSIIIHLCIALVLFILLETVGLYLLNYKLSIPLDYIYDAHVVFHCTVAIAIVSTLCIPFDALILSRERMNFYAGIAIFDSVCKLLLILALDHFQHPLRMYGIFLLCEQILVTSTSFLYSRFNFAECRLNFKCDSVKFKEMAIFSGWGFLGNIAFSIANEVTNFIINIFGGVVYNASRSIAYQIKGALVLFLSNGMIALRPQATQMYAANERRMFFNVILFSSKLMYFLSLVIGLPIIFYTQKILLLWLGEIPHMSDVFIRLILIQMLIRSFHEPIDLVFKSSGNLKYYQTISLSSTLFVLPLSYFSLLKGFPIYTVFIILILMEFIEYVGILLLSTREGLPIKKYLRQVSLPCFYITVIGVLVCWGCKYYISYKVPFLFNMILMVALLLFVIYLIGINKTEKSQLIGMIKKKINL